MLSIGVYFHLSFFPLKEPETPLLCLVHDTTSMAVLQQQLAQQHNEISLLEGLLRSQGDYSTVRILGESEVMIGIRTMIDKISNVHGDHSADRQKRDRQEHDRAGDPPHRHGEPGAFRGD